MFNRIAVLFGLVVAIGLVGAGVWCGLKIRQLNQANSQLNEQLMQAKLEIGKAHTAFGEAQQKISLLDKQLRDEIKAHKELVSKYGELLAAYNAQGHGSSDPQSGNDGTQIVVSRPLFKSGNIYVAQTEYVLQSYSPPISFKLLDSRLSITASLVTVPGVEPKTYRLKENFEYKLSLKIMAQLVETITESGAVNNYANIYEIDENGNKIGKFELSSFEVIVEDLRKPRFSLWNPRFDVGIAGGFDGKLIYGGDLGVSLMSYGVSKNDPSWRFAKFGLMLSSTKGYASFSPCQYNVAKLLGFGLFNNIWISPNIMYGGSFAGSISVGATL